MNKSAVEWLKKYHRFTNYLSVAMLYLQDNYFLEEKLKPEHIKSRILGHWGTVPGLNFIYGGLNHLISKTNQKTLFVAGPGHGAPAILAGLFVEGVLEEFYPLAKRNRDGFEYVSKMFSWPGGFPSHTYPGIPGSILEGGELGYSLGVAFGAAFDNPDLLVACVIGDGEAETGPLAAAWQSIKFMNPEEDGAVLPILHVNGYKISGPTIFGTMTDEEIREYFEGLGYKPHIVNQYELKDLIYDAYLNELDHCHKEIKHIKDNWKEKWEKPEWPIIILRTMKGWTVPDQVDGRIIEDHNNSHGIPLQNPKKNAVELTAIEEWLQSYKIEELLTSDKNYIAESVTDFIPHGEFRMGANIHANGGNLLKEIVLPDLNVHAIPVVQPGTILDSRMKELGEYLRDVFMLNEQNSNFRLFSPDESESNMLEGLYDATERRYLRPVRAHDEHYSFHGRIMEILSEHVLTEWMQGYLLTGRHGLLISYEAFLGIVTSQIDQFLKYLKQASKFSWRAPVSGMNFIATSTAWRQDHNGFSHQNPSLINTLLSKPTDFVRIYLPSDVNTLLASMHQSLQSKDVVNLTVACKRNLPQYLSMDEAIEHVKSGISIWDWASNEHHLPSEIKGDKDVDVVLASAGDYQTFETLAACNILKETIPELKFRYVNVNEITRLGLGTEDNPVMTERDFHKYFTDDRAIIFNFHGYPDAIKQITWGRSIANRLTILGYLEEGSTTTPFDMQVRNKASRYHVCIEAILAGMKVNSLIANKGKELINQFSNLLKRHELYIVEHGDDMPEVTDFKLKF